MKNNRFFNAGMLALLLAFGFCLMMVSCKVSTENLAKQVQENMIETWQEQGIDVKVTKDLLLIKKNNAEYSGLITVSAEGETKQITVNVIYDGKSFAWETAGETVIEDNLSLADGSFEQQLTQAVIQKMKADYPDYKYPSGVTLEKQAGNRYIADGVTHPEGHGPLAVIVTVKDGLRDFSLEFAY